MAFYCRRLCGSWLQTETVFFLLHSFFRVVLGMNMMRACFFRLSSHRVDMIDCRGSPCVGAPRDLALFSRFSLSYFSV